MHLEILAWRQSHETGNGNGTESRAEMSSLEREREKKMKHRICDSTLGSRPRALKRQTPNFCHVPSSRITKKKAQKSLLVYARQAVHSPLFPQNTGFICFFPQSIPLFHTFSSFVWIYMVQHIVHNLKDCFTFVGLLLDMVVRVVGILFSPRSPIFSRFVFYVVRVSITR